MKIDKNKTNFICRPTHYTLITTLLSNLKIVFVFTLVIKVTSVSWLLCCD